jgi:hypothetical protein
LQLAAPPKLMFTTRAGVGLVGAHCVQEPLGFWLLLQVWQTARPAAQRMPSTMSLTEAPHLPATRTGRMRTPQLAPPRPAHCRRWRR